MCATGISPQVMVGFFEAIERWRGQQSFEAGESATGMAFASHPATAERIQFFKDATQQ